MNHSYVVTNAPDTPQIGNAIADVASRSNGWLIIAGAAGLLGGPMFDFQKNEPFKTIRTISSLLAIAWGVWGYTINGNKINF